MKISKKSEIENLKDLLKVSETKLKLLQELHRLEINFITEIKSDKELDEVKSELRHCRGILLNYHVVNGEIVG